jgi:very-short-patch-repair endonuclease
MNAEELAERQYGLVTRAQARELLSDSAVDRRLSSRRWIAIRPGVYRIVGAPVTARQRAMGAALWGGPDAAISHSTAGRLLRLPGIPHDAIHLNVPPKSGVRSDDLRLHRAALSRADRVYVDNIPCTAATRTLLDCASLLDGEHLETAVERARRMGLTSTAALSAQLRRGRPGSAKLRDVIRHLDARPKESRLEVKLARLLRKSDLPKAVAQFVIGSYRVDYAWPLFRVICECDGFEWHGDRLCWKRDRRRVAAIEAEDWHVVHVTWDDITRYPDETLYRLGLALRRAA